MDTTGTTEVDWSFIALGIILILLGAFAIGVPFITTLALAYALGVILIIGGFAHAVHMIKTVREGGFILKLITTLIYLAAGIFLLAYPLAGAVVLTLVLAIFWTVSGIVKIVNALQLRHLPHWGWMLFSGIVTLILGIIIWSMWPLASLWVLGLFVGIDLIMAGWMLITMPMAVRGGFFTPLYRPT